MTEIGKHPVSATRVEVLLWVWICRPHEAISDRGCFGMSLTLGGEKPGPMVLDITRMLDLHWLWPVVPAKLTPNSQHP